MADVTKLLAEIESGDRQSAEELLPLVYEELRRLAAARLGNEKPGQTLQATALVHEAYVRLVVSVRVRRIAPSVGGAVFPTCSRCVFWRREPLVNGHSAGGFRLGAAA